MLIKLGTLTIQEYVFKKADTAITQFELHTYLFPICSYPENVREIGRMTYQFGNNNGHCH